jgi:hypothetical protein
VGRALTAEELEFRRKIPVRTETWEGRENVSGQIQTRQAVIEVGPEETLTITYELLASLLGRLGYEHIHTEYPERKDPNHR